MQQGLSDDQVRDFVDRFMAAYAIGYPALLRKNGFWEGEDGSLQQHNRGRFMRITIDEERNVIDNTII